MNLSSSRVLFAFFGTLATGGAIALAACSSDESASSSSSGGPDGAASSSSSSSGSSSGNFDSGGSDSGTDANTEDSGCTPAPPLLDGGGPCGTLAFGAGAAPFGGVDGGDTYAGGSFAAGIYDAIGAERASGSGGSWRETFVVDGTGRFTRIRQIDTGTSGGPGPISQRSGTVTTNGSNATFTYDCAETGGAAVDAGPDTLPFEVVKNGCDVAYRYGVTGIRITLKRR